MSRPRASLPDVQPETIAPAAEPQPAMQAEAEPVRSAISEESHQETEKAARRRSTVREKVSFPTSAVPAATPAEPVEVELPVAASAETSPASEATKRRLRARPAGGRAASAAASLWRFRAKWLQVRARKTHQNKNPKPGSDSIRTERLWALWNLRGCGGDQP